MLHVYSSSDHNEVIAIDSKLCVHTSGLSKLRFCHFVLRQIFQISSLHLALGLLDPFLWCSHVISTSHDTQAQPAQSQDFKQGY